MVTAPTTMSTNTSNSHSTSTVNFNNQHRINSKQNVPKTDTFNNIQNLNLNVNQLNHHLSQSNSLYHTGQNTTQAVHAHQAQLLQNSIIQQQILHNQINSHQTFQNVQVNNLNEHHNNINHLGDNNLQNVISNNSSFRQIEDGNLNGNFIPNHHSQHLVQNYIAEQQVPKQQNLQNQIWQTPQFQDDLQRLLHQPSSLRER